MTKIVIPDNAPFIQPPKKRGPIQFSVETLYHFSCKVCAKWFSIADFPVTGTTRVTCPHCQNVATPTPFEPVPT